MDAHKTRGRVSPSPSNTHRTRFDTPGSDTEVTIVGGGIAGVEAAWQLAERGVRVRLIEMRPDVMTPAHHGGHLAELVCSNSLKGGAA